MTKSKILFWFCLSIILGVSLGSIIRIPASDFPLRGLALFFLSVGGLILVSVFWRKQPAVVFGFCLIFFALGLWRVNYIREKVSSNDFIKYGIYNQKTEITGRIVKEPDVRDATVKLTVGDLVISKNKKDIPVSGNILLTVYRYPEYEYGENLKITGKIETPPVFEGFNYKDYLLKEGIYGVMAFPKVEIAKDQSSHNFSLYGAVLGFKGKLRKSIYNNFSPPERFILEGTILGDNGAMGNDFKNKLNITGLRHVIAVSGSHIVVLSSVIMSLLLLLGMRKGQAFYFAIITVAIFIVMSGMSASGVRAGIMGGIFLLAQKTGRKNMSARTIIIALALMLLVNPLLLFYDVGFQLSFLAAFGIIYLSPSVDRFINISFLKKSADIRSMASTTIGAQIFTFPILIFSFGSVSLVSPITNFLILPIAPILMSLGFLSAILGIFSKFLGWMFSLPLWVLLNYFIKVIDCFSRPWAIKAIENVSWVWLALSYVILGLSTRYLANRRRLSFLR